jgi:hypothetical protein
MGGIERARNLQELITKVERRHTFGNLERTISPVRRRRAGGNLVRLRLRTSSHRPQHKLHKPKRKREKGVAESAPRLQTDLSQERNEVFRAPPGVPVHRLPRIVVGSARARVLHDCSQRQTTNKGNLRPFTTSAIIVIITFFVPRSEKIGEWREGWGKETHS